MPGTHAHLAKRRPRSRFRFVVHNRNHVRLFAGAAALLADDGYECAFVTLEDIHPREGASETLARYGLSAITLAEAEPQIVHGDIVVVGNDWAPKALGTLLESRGERGFRAVGYVDGCRMAAPIKYRRVDHVLGWGPASREMFPAPVTVVGNSQIEKWARQAPRFADPPFAVVNYKFLYHRRAGRAEWTDSVLGACRACGLAARVSRHPSDPDDPLGLPSEPLDDLLRDGALLITRPSTAIYEAMSAGKPVVFFPRPDEDLGEFADPLGAFDIAAAPEELPHLIRRALAERRSYPARCRAFLERHVSIDPARPASARMADALATLAEAAGTPGYSAA